MKISNSSRIVFADEPFWWKIIVLSTSTDYVDVLWGGVWWTLFLGPAFFHITLCRQCGFTCFIVWFSGRMLVLRIRHWNKSHVPLTVMDHNHPTAALPDIMNFHVFSRQSCGFYVNKLCRYLWDIIAKKDKVIYHSGRIGEEVNFPSTNTWL